MLADWAKTLHKLSDMALAIDQRDEAMRLRQRALAIRQGLVQADSEHVKWKRDLAISFVLVGDLLDLPDQVGERRDLYEKALAIDEDLIAMHPDEPVTMNDLAFDYERLGNMAKNRGDFPAAETFFEKQHALAQTLVDRFPDGPSAHWALLCSLGQLAAMNKQKGDMNAAARVHVDALRISERLVELEPDNPEFIKARISAAGSVAADQEDSHWLLEYHALMEPYLRELVEMNPGIHDQQRDQAGFYLGLTSVYFSLKDFENAERYALQAINVLHSLPLSAYDNLDQLRLVLTASTSAAKCAHLRGDAKAKSVHGGEAVRAANRLEAKLGNDATMLHSLAVFWTDCDTPELCDPAKGESLARRSIELSHETLPRPWLTLAQALHALQRDDEACKAVRRALELFPPNQGGLGVGAMELAAELQCLKGPAGEPPIGMGAYDKHDID